MTMTGLIRLHSKADLFLIRLIIALTDTPRVNRGKETVSRLWRLARKTVPGKRVSHASPRNKNPAVKVEVVGDRGGQPSAVETASVRPAAQSNGSDVPIILIHAGDPDYLQYSLSCARKYNRESRICLLGDHSNSHYEFLEHYPFSAYSGRADQFARFYTNHSTNGRGFELFCFQRWFILCEFLKEQGIDKCLYLDSDVMLFADAKDEQKKFDEFDFALATTMMACVLYLNDPQVLENFCAFLEDIYTKKDRYHYDKMLAHYAVRRKNGLKGGACDMTAFELFNLDYFAFVGNVVQIIDGSVYDPAMTTPYPGFETEQQIKRVYWREGQPFGKHLKTDRYIRFNSMHFQGRSKSLMKQVYDRISQTP